jgi:hypothetical protein
MTRTFRILALAVALLVTGSGGCTGGTGSQRFSFTAQVRGTAPSATGDYRFVNEKGWRITLTRATVTLGPVYLNVVPALGSESASLWDWVVRPAYAQGEMHLSSGRVVGEVLSQVTFDALTSDAVAFPSGGSVTQEQVRTAEVWFYPEPGTPGDARQLDTVALDIAGSAERDGEVVRFRGLLKLDEAWISEQNVGSRGNLSLTEIRKVRGISADFFPSQGGMLELGFDVKRLLRGADFASLASNQTDADGTKILLPGKAGDQVMTNLYQGLHQVDQTYSVRWVLP